MMRAKWISAASPAGWPSVSLSSLKSIEVGVDQCARRAGPRGSAWSISSSNLRRLARPVRPVGRRVRRALVGFERAGEPRSRVRQRLHQLGQRARRSARGRRAARWPPHRRPRRPPESGSSITAPGRWRRSGTAPPSGSPSIDELPGLAAGDARDVADLGHEGVEQSPVAATGHADDADRRQRREGADVPGSRPRPPSRRR